MYGATIGTSRYVFPDLKTLMAKATPARSGDRLAGIAAATGEERVAAQYALADLPLATFLTEHVVPYESDEVTRLISTLTMPRPSPRSRISPSAACATGCSPTPRPPTISRRSLPASRRRWRRR